LFSAPVWLTVALKPDRDWLLGFRFLGGLFADRARPAITEPFERFRAGLREREKVDNIEVRSITPPAGFESVLADQCRNVRRVVVRMPCNSRAVICSRLYCHYGIVSARHFTEPSRWCGL
jgi:hypothetical protein